MSTLQNHYIIGDIHGELLADEEVSMTNTWVFAGGIVISHASIGDFWDLEEINYKHFEFYIMTNRRRPSADSPIFNIYGHTNVQSVVIGQNFVNLDTGCGRKNGGKLSAYCLETQEVFDVVM